MAEGTTTTTGATDNTAELKAEIAALREQVGGQSKTIGSLQSLTKKYETLEGELKKLTPAGMQPAPEGAPAAKTPLEQQFADLKKQLDNERAAAKEKEKLQARQAVTDRVQRTIEELLDGKVVSRKVAKDLAERLVEKKLHDQTLEIDGEQIRVGEGAKQVALDVYVDAWLASEGSDYQVGKANPPKDGLTLGGGKLSSATKGLRRDNNGVLIIPALKTS